MELQLDGWLAALRATSSCLCNQLVNYRPFSLRDVVRSQAFLVRGTIEADFISWDPALGLRRSENGLSFNVIR